MANTNSYIDPATLKRLSVLDPRRTALTIAVDWLVIIAAIAISEWANNLLVYLAMAFVIAGRMHGLGVIIHECAHYRFLANKTLNDIVGDLFLAWPLLTTVGGYRNNHLAHHRYTNTDRDPDWVVRFGKYKFTFPLSWQRALINLGGNLFIVGSLFDIAQIMPRISRFDAMSRRRKLARLAFYVVVLAAVTATGTWAGFLKYWVLPYFSVFFLFLYVRTVAEHFGDMEYEDELTDTRTVVPFRWEQLFIPHNVNYHLEHHLYPSVPFYNLPELHKILMQNPDYAGRAHITRGYTVGLVKECIAPPFSALRKPQQTA